MFQPKIKSNVILSRDMSAIYVADKLIYFFITHPLAGELTELVKEREIKVEKIRVYLWRKMGKKAGFVWIPQQS